MPKVRQIIQRNRLTLVERADAQAAQRDDVPEGAQPPGEVAGERADVNALAAVHLEVRVIRTLAPDQGEGNRRAPRAEQARSACPHAPGSRRAVPRP